jgi:hypothetical protein
MIVSCPPAVGIGLALGRGARPPPSCESGASKPVRQGQSLRSGPADSLRSPLTAGPAALDLADYRVRPSSGQPRDWAVRRRWAGRLPKDCPQSQPRFWSWPGRIVRASVVVRRLPVGASGCRWWGRGVRRSTRSGGALRPAWRSPVQFQSRRAATPPCLSAPIT